jgi:hypothetical protein
MIGRERWRERKESEVPCEFDGNTLGCRKGASDDREKKRVVVRVNEAILHKRNPFGFSRISSNDQTRSSSALKLTLIDQR